MIYVAAGNYHEFQNFLQAFRLREDFGQQCGPAGCRRGQVRFLSAREEMMRGLDHTNIVLCWGTYGGRRDIFEIENYCRVRRIPFITVPDPVREAYRQLPPFVSRFEHTCIKDDGGTPGRKCYACEAER